MTLAELEKKYKGYEIYYWGKSNFTKTLKDCKGHTPYTFMSGVAVKDYGKLKVIDFEVVEKPNEAINLAITSKGLVGKGVTKHKGYVYALLDRESLNKEG